jgi:hypothetical protein
MKMWIFLKPDNVSIKNRKRSPRSGFYDPWSVSLAPLLGDRLSSEEKSVACQKVRSVLHVKTMVLLLTCIALPHSSS